MAWLHSNPRPTDMPQLALLALDQHSYIKLQLVCSSVVAVVGNVTITHPFLGKGDHSLAPWTLYVPRTVCTRPSMLSRTSSLFLLWTQPTASKATMLLSCYILSHCTAEEYSYLHWWPVFRQDCKHITAFCAHLDRFNNWFSALVSLALCKAQVVAPSSGYNCTAYVLTMTSMSLPLSQ